MTAKCQEPILIRAAGLWYHRGMDKGLTVIGAGLAGCEAAVKAADQGVPVELWEMKPGQYTPAHSNPLAGELVCSNSLRSADPTSAAGLLKAEMAMLGSVVMRAARAHRTPAGGALAVDRERFAAFLDAELNARPLITRRRGRVDKLPESGLTVLAAGPLIADELAADQARVTGAQGLHFYDAIAPIVTAESVDPKRSFWADRYGDGAGDYLNCPLSKQEFQAFYQALAAGEQTPLHDFESPRFFEGCLPIEVMAARGEKTLLFGPMKPVGLVDPAEGRRPFAVVQLRKEDKDGRLLNLVGFQTKLTRPAQDRVLRLIPALARAEFVRWGSIHRNTFLDAPRVLDADLRLKAAPHIMIAGQLSGVEGYVESAAMGLLCGINAPRILAGLPPLIPPAACALGGLLTHLGNTQTKNFQPSNINFGLLPPLPKRYPKKERGRQRAIKALAELAAWMAAEGLSPAEPAPVL